MPCVAPPAADTPVSILGSSALIRASTNYCVTSIFVGGGHSHDHARAKGLNRYFASIYSVEEDALYIAPFLTLVSWNSRLFHLIVVGGGYFPRSYRPRCLFSYYFTSMVFGLVTLQ